MVYMQWPGLYPAWASIYMPSQQVPSRLQWGHLDVIHTDALHVLQFSLCVSVDAYRGAPSEHYWQ